MRFIPTTLLTILVFPFVSHAAEPLFLSESHPRSNRFVLLEEADGCAWMYLSFPGEPKPEKDAFVYSIEDPTPVTDWSRVEQGLHPKLPQKYASATAIMRDVKQENLRFRWADDGESVAVAYHGNVIAMILKDERRGFSHALSKAGPLGLPMDSERMKRFAEESEPTPEGNGARES